MATGLLSGSTMFYDLALVFNTTGTNDLEVLQNKSNATTISFTTHVITGSVFSGTAVGVAIGTLSTGGNYTDFQDIAVLYAATASTGIPANESMVRIFQNEGVVPVFAVTPNPVTGGDYDADQTNPTAITVANLSGAWGNLE